MRRDLDAGGGGGRRGAAFGRVLRRLLAAIAVGFGSIFRPKAQEQHWSETTSQLAEEEREEDGSSSD